MKKDSFHYRKVAAFINRERELRDLRAYINEEPESMLFLHGPKSSGKTTLLYRFFKQTQEEQNLDVKFLNLRKKSIHNYKDFVKIFFGIDNTKSKSKDDVKEKREYGLFGLFKLSVEELKGMKSGQIDPFEIMEKEFIKLRNKAIKPIIIIDELQAIEHIYTDEIEGTPGRQLIIELFNFFVAMTKESHLAHIIIASSDGYFLNTVFNDSRLKKTSMFYKIDYLGKKDVMEWLLNLEKYSKINAYTITETDVEKIWDTVGGSMWEIQDILSEIFDRNLDDVLQNYKEKMLGMVTYYIVQNERKKKEKILKHFVDHEKLSAKDTREEDQELLKDMVKNNILYFDPTEAVYYPQGTSYRWGIQLFFKS